MPIRTTHWALLVAMLTVSTMSSAAEAAKPKSGKSKRVKTVVVEEQVAPPPAEEAIDPTVQPLEYVKNGLLKNGLLPRFFKDVTVDGAVEATYTYNDRRPRNGVNPFRSYDRRHNAGMLNQVQVRMQKEATEESPVGFGLRVNAGKDAEVFKTQTEEFEDHVELQEAYGSLRLPVGRGVTVKAGKLPSPVGAEVIETRDNFNISRGLLFGLFQPSTVTGVRFEAPVTDQVAVSAGVIRGWDVAYEDVNSAESIEAKVTLTPQEGTSLAVGVVTGPEQAGNNNNRRTLVDVLLNQKIDEKTDAFVNVDYITEEGAGVNGGGADATGAAIGVRRALTEKLSIAGRLEVVDDKDGGRTGVRQSLGSGTITGEYKFRKNVIGKVEYRHDTSSDSTFVSDVRPVSNQNTISTALLVTF